MNKKRLTILLSTICAVVLLVIAIVPALASSPESPRAEFAATLEQLTEEGVINSEQAEIIMERIGPIFGKIVTTERAYQRRVGELALARSRPILLRISQALDMKPNELLPQLKEGKTVAQIAEGKGVSDSEVVDELLVPVREGLDKAVAEGKLSQEQAKQKLSEAEARITEMVQKATLKEIVGHEVKKIRKQDERARKTRVLLHQVCQIVNLDREELLSQLKEGKKIVEVAQEQGVSRDELLKSLIDSAQDRLDRAVGERKLDEQKAVDLKQKIEEGLTRFVDNFPPER